MVNFYIYYNTHTHTHTHIFIYLFINIKNSNKPETVNRYWPISEIYRIAAQTSTAFGTVLTPLILISKYHILVMNNGGSRNFFQGVP